MLKLPNSTYFFFNDTATTEIYTLSLHDALPISLCCCAVSLSDSFTLTRAANHAGAMPKKTPDRKSTRLNSSHLVISYAVFCLKKKKILKFQIKLKKNLPCSSLLYCKL